MGIRRTSVRYYACVAILVMSAVGMQMAARRLGGHFRKEAVPLKRPLAALDLEKLAPEYVRHPIQPEPLRGEMLQNLGTEDYFQLRLVDTRRARTDPARVATVLITYYTGQPDMVPHVPDECFQAGGYDPVPGAEMLSLPIPGAGAPRDQVPVRMVQFQSREGQDRPTVLYFFHTNGEYQASRDGVRWKLTKSVFQRYAYYSKIEVSFNDESDDPRRTRRAGKKESVEAIGPLLAKLMPVLLADHWAWDRVTGGTALEPWHTPSTPKTGG